MKPNRKYVPYIVLFALTIFLCWLFAGRIGVFGSEIDWLSQHSVLPDYFRQQFYETGELIPEFAPSIGGGQNIYNFAYYGLFSPLILPSYLLPFVKMSTYIMAISVLTLTASILLFYYWLGTHDFSVEIRLGTSLLFLLAGPMIFQSYRQIMFVNYMPFLILALIGVDIFRKKGSTLLFTAGIFLMIMTSFYFSICGMLVVFLYGITRFHMEKSHRIRRFFHFMLPFFTAVLTSAILLIPTACTLFVRSSSTHKINLGKLFIPDLSLTHFTYTGYGVGLSVGILLVLILGIFIQKPSACLQIHSKHLAERIFQTDSSEKILSVFCLTVLTLPVFSWILNGGLYLRDKAFIPFLPLLCYLTASFLQTLQKRRHNPLCYYKPPHSGFLPRRLYFPNIVSHHLPVFLLAPFLIYLMAAGLYLNQTKGAITEETFCENLWDSSWKAEIDAVLSSEKGLYRLEQNGSLKENNANMNRIWNTRQWTSTLYSSAYNQDYQTFLTDTFQAELPYNNAISHAISSNPLFRKLMGVKRLVKKSDTGIFSTETLESAAPVIYTTDALLSSKKYEKLSFPYNQTALMQYAVTDKTTASDSTIKEKIMDSAVPVEISFPKERTVQKKGNSYYIQANKTTDTCLLLQSGTSSAKQLFFLQFEVKNHCTNQSMFTEVNGIRNKLSAANHIYYNDNHTFTFVTELEPGQTEIPVIFGKGSYTLSDVKSYIGNESLLTDHSLYQSEFKPDWTQTKGSRITGEIKAPKDGYVITSIPFDKGFEVRTDGQTVTPEKVNTAFLGFPVTKGTHQLEITYHAPGVPLGKLLSLLGVFLWAAQLFMASAARTSPQEHACPVTLEPGKVG